jgi:uncharacterized protein
MGLQVLPQQEKERPVSFDSDGLRLQGLFFRPDGGEPRAAVVCHPHPLYGGSMRNSVVEAILEAMWSLDIATLRFNFRGVGGSEGEYDDGIGEVADAQSAVRYVTQLPGIQRGQAILAGYSFGASAALKAAGKMPEVATVVAVAPPIVTDAIPRMEEMKKRLVVVAGEEDRYCPSAQLEAMRNTLLGLMRLKIIPGADHFFSGQEATVTAALIEALSGA